MKNLTLILLIIEYHRLGTRLKLLILVLLAYGAILSCDPKSMDKISFQSKIEINNNSTPAPDASTPVLQDFQKMIKSLPAFGAMAFALCLGGIILLTFGFRSRDDWQSGIFQMFLLSDHTLVLIEGIRYLILLVISLIFMLLVQGLGTLYLWQGDLIPWDILGKLNVWLLFWFVTIMPLVYSVGSLASASDMAYYARGNSKILQLVKFLGLISLIKFIILAGLHFSDERVMAFLPRLTLNFGGGLSSLTVTLPFDYLFFSLAASILAMVWNGKIYQDLEV